VARCDVPNKDVLPFPPNFTVQASGQSIDNLATKVNILFKELDVRWQWRSSMNAGVALAKENVWSRAARRKKRRQSEMPLHGNDEMEIDEAHGLADDSMDTESEEAVALAVKISVFESKVDVRWLKGVETILFESFCGMLKRELTK
jgi:23S rRNA (adenine1618-N6)-methyltransferase